jgi:hypothetical protein
MSSILADAQAGRKNVVFGIALFLLLGVVVGIPLTIDFFGGSLLTAEQYGTWKVVHGYGVFLGFINYFFGLSVDRLRLTTRQKAAASWSLLCAGFIGGVVRMTLVLFSALDDFGLYASLGEVVFITVGTAIFVMGQVRRTVGETAVSARSPGSLTTSPR